MEEKIEDGYLRRQGRMILRNLEARFVAVLNSTCEQRAPAVSFFLFVPDHVHTYTYRNARFYGQARNRTGGPRLLSLPA